MAKHNKLPLDFKVLLYLNYEDGLRTLPQIARHVQHLNYIEVYDVLVKWNREGFLRHLAGGWGITVAGEMYFEELDRIEKDARKAPLMGKGKCTLHECWSYPNGASPEDYCKENSRKETKEVS